MSSAWIYQDDKQVKKVGEAKASWYVGWLDPDGKRRCKSCGPGEQGHRDAEKLCKKRESELNTETYKTKSTVLWDDFVQEYTERILDGLEPRTRLCATDALAHFKKHVRPVKVYYLDTPSIDLFISKRRGDRGKKPGSKVSPATINKDLRHLKAALRVAVEWGYLPKVPRFRMEKVGKKLVRYVTPEHFAAIYRACDTATMPKGLPFPAVDWWRGLFVFAYMTGWRISEILALARTELDLDNGYALTLYEDNKGDRDDRVKLHPVVIDHLKKLACFEKTVFPWLHDRSTIELQLDRIQTAAGIDLPCQRKHQHTPACHKYGFHDFRRAFATMNATRLTPDALQALMRHKSYLTTQVYINMARQLDEAVNVLHVPEVLDKAAGRKMA
jgi:integrase